MSQIHAGSSQVQPHGKRIEKAEAIFEECTVALHYQLLEASQNPIHASNPLFTHYPV